jgi:hypothetical protein
MNKIMSGMENRKFYHQYHQVLQIHREVGKLDKRMDKLEGKLDKILSKLDYIGATDDMKGGK